MATKKATNKKQKTVVIGVIGADVHVVGNKIIERTLQQEGINVVNIGVLSSQQDFINAAIESGADGILVSSLYGHGELDCQGMRGKMIEAGLKNTPLMVGGNIVVGKQDTKEVMKKFKDMGFDEVFMPGEQIFDVLPVILKRIGM